MRWCCVQLVRLQYLLNSYKVAGSYEIRLTKFISAWSLMLARSASIA